MVYKLEASPDLTTLQTGMGVVINGLKLGSRISGDGKTEATQVLVQNFQVTSELHRQEREVVVTPPDMPPPPSPRPPSPRPPHQQPPPPPQPRQPPASRMGGSGGSLGSRHLLTVGGGVTVDAAVLPTIQISLEAADVSTLFMPLSFEGCPTGSGGTYTPPWYTKAVRPSLLAVYIAWTALRIAPLEHCASAECVNACARAACQQWPAF